jgi:hypothetical protein
MSPKSGKAGSAVNPAEPVEVHGADNADPGKVAEVKKRERETKKGKYGTTPIKPFKSSDNSGGGGGTDNNSEEAEPVSWVEIEMIDEEDQPVVGLRYEITVPEGTVATGTLDERGCARVDGIKPGECKITFPSLDKEAWESA